MPPQFPPARSYCSYVLMTMMKYEDADSVSPKPGGALGHGFDTYVHVLMESEF